MVSRYVRFKYDLAGLSQLLGTGLALEVLSFVLVGQGEHGELGIGDDWNRFLGD